MSDFVFQIPNTLMIVGNFINNLKDKELKLKEINEH